jgi:hypothetical protein
MYATLYARALNGKIKVWSIDYMYGKILIRNGYFTNSLAVHSSSPKMASVDSELMSKINAKKKEGYKDINDIYALANSIPPNGIVTEEWLQQVLPKSNLDSNYNLKPMKCQKFKLGKMQYPAIGQPKYNGVRAILRWESNVTGVGLFTENRERAVFRSKLGLEYHFPHITIPLTKDYFIDDETGLQVAYDGELYLHDTPLNIINSACPLINENGVIAKTSNPVVYSNIQFIVFDVAVEDLSQSNRIKLITKVDSFFNPIVSSPSRTLYSDDAVINYTLECIANGYEGCIVRNIDAEYAFGSRPMTIMKSKQFQDAEFEVIDIVSKGLEAWSDGSDVKFVLKNDINDATFDCMAMFSNTERLHMLYNKSDYIGKCATVKFYERSGVKQVPFHANVVTIRDYE